MYCSCVQKSFAEDATLSERLFDLLDTTFPGISQTAQSLSNLSAAWESVANLFLCLHDSRAIRSICCRDLGSAIRNQV